MNNDERGEWTHASQAGADKLCAGRHLAQRGIKDERSKDAEFGDRIHEALRKQDPAGLDPTEADVYESCNNIANKVLAQFFGPHFDKVKTFREQRYWVDMTQLGAGKHSGRFDLVAVAGTKAAVIDYKTLPGDVPESPKNLQLRDGAVLVKGQTVVTAEVAVAIVQPFVTHDPEICVYNLDDLNRAAMELIERVKASNNPESKRTAGQEQCKFCRAKLQCPEYQAWYGASVPQMSSLVGITVANWTPEQRKEYCDKRTIAYAWLEQCDKHIKAGLTTHPDFVPGYWMEPGDWREKVVKLEELFARFEALGGKLPGFMNCLSLVKEPFEGEVAAVTQQKGKALKATMTNLYRDLVERKQNAPSLARKKEAK